MFLLGLRQFFVMRNDLFIILCDDADETNQTEVEDATTSTKGRF